MRDAPNHVRNLNLRQNPNAGKQDKDSAISVAVHLDGTWHKRGYSSKYGVVIVIPVVYLIMFFSMHCHVSEAST